MPCLTLSTLPCVTNVSSSQAAARASERRSSRASDGRALTSRFLDNAEAESLEFKRRLADHETRPRYYACDLTDVAAIRALFPHIREQLGPIDVLINNAANDDRHTVEDRQCYRT